MAAPEQIAAFLANPANFLIGLDLGQGQFQFIRMPRQEVSDKAFLDTRAIETRHKKTELPGAAVLETLRGEMTKQPPLKACYLFHTSFCCSTLIARCLDMLGINLSLKEPYAFLGLSAFKRLSASFDPAGPSWKNLRDITLYLLSRSFYRGEKILFKPSNGTNNILPEILAFPQTDRVLLLYDDLESFLIAVLRGGRERAGVIGQILEGLVKDFSDNLPVEIDQIRSLTELQKTALVWGLQMRFFQQTIALDNDLKVKSLKSTTFLQSPGKTLKKLNDFYGLEFSEKDQKEILNGPAFNSHSKDPGIIFSKSKQIKEKENVLKIFREDIRETLIWANSHGLDYKGGLSNPL
ncbi:MAG: hypothetical protein IH901_05050 [Proteobacteria bacterium]|nr:hypothetical protein [Pseudomonadota bacterium]